MNAMKITIIKTSRSKMTCFYVFMMRIMIFFKPNKQFLIYFSYLCAISTTTNNLNTSVEQT